MLRLEFVVFVLLLSLSGTALANPPTESSDPAPKVVYKATTEIDIEDVRVDAENTKPLGTSILERRTHPWTPLLSPRTNFDAEMLESVTAVR